MLLAFKCFKKILKSMKKREIFNKKNAKKKSGRRHLTARYDSVFLLCGSDVSLLEELRVQSSD